MAEPIEIRDADWGLTHVGQRNNVLDEGRDPHGKGQFLGIVRPIEKHWGSLLPCTQQKGSISFQ